MHWTYFTCISNLFWWLTFHSGKWSVAVDPRRAELRSHNSLCRTERTTNSVSVIALQHSAHLIHCSVFTHLHWCLSLHFLYFFLLPWHASFSFISLSFKVPLQYSFTSTIRTPLLFNCDFIIFSEHLLCFKRLLKPILWTDRLGTTCIIILWNWRRGAPNPAKLRELLHCREKWCGVSLGRIYSVNRCHEPHRKLIVTGGIDYLEKDRKLYKLCRIIY